MIGAFKIKYFSKLPGMFKFLLQRTYGRGLNPLAFSHPNPPCNIKSQCLTYQNSPHIYSVIKYDDITTNNAVSHIKSVTESQYLWGRSERVEC